VPAAAQPTGNTVGDWVANADANVGQLDKANERTRDAVGIVRYCEARDKETAKALRPRRFFGIF